MRTIITLLLVLFSGCTEQPVTTPTPDAAIAPVPATCSSAVTLSPVGGGNPTCDATVTITVACAAGASGHFQALYGEAGAATLYTASADAAYQCGVPVILTRDGISCSSLVAADVVYWDPSGNGPIACD